MFGFDHFVFWGVPLRGPYSFCINNFGSLGFACNNQASTQEKVRPFAHTKTLASHHARVPRACRSLWHVCAPEKTPDIGLISLWFKAYWDLESISRGTKFFRDRRRRSMHCVPCVRCFALRPSLTNSMAHDSCHRTYTNPNASIHRVSVTGSQTPTLLPCHRTCTKPNASIHHVNVT